MLLIGLLYCRFSSLDEQQRELWLLINPRLRDQVKKSEIISVLLDLLYLAIDQRLKIENTKEVKNLEDIAYLEGVLTDKPGAISMVMGMILSDEVD
mmetsp:Transcript_14155/g.13738  ORF Transcript_14155/g.13738 Transcript_14155/m.13738 type:complete len:96 (+) Transcript_14155:94-381(+)|eukprot:CAMPEP_0170546976 /NCGR_PEP_ID=MMETSP0211-20121228/5351_1 /TAXON_ID=311385 /ORGANISM="Pseudokeronopsis sp., Strain OXSARD2" /LENGTH=95 /DNA_ID=CAMNT_0010851737 /DNA_START=236 /DNA_END=523 /DNA_ORIENTATION=-